MNNERHRTPTNNRPHPEGKGRYRVLDQTTSVDEAMRLLNSSERKVAIAAVNAVLEQRINNTLEYIRIEIQSGGLVDENA